LITTRWFSSSLSDPASRRTPCPPKIRRWRLQVSLSVSRLSPLCLTSLSIPFHHLRPVRHYPHLWISARGLGLSGTSTHLTRQLSGTHYELLRPCAPLRYSSPCGWRRLDVSLGIGATGSHVPHKSLVELRAVYMPDATRAGFRLLPSWSRRKGHPPVSTSPNPLSTLHQRFACARLSQPCLPGSCPGVSATLPSRPGEFHPEHRVTGGGRPPPVPTERSVQISRTTLFRR